MFLNDVDLFFNQKCEIKAMVMVLCTPINVTTPKRYILNNCAFSYKKIYKG